jgi:hypothetical protein
MAVKGEVVSYGLTRPESSRNVNYNGAFDGWRVTYRFSCSCGKVHDLQALNVWPTGDSITDITKAACPTTGKDVEVELVRPN